MTKYVGTPQQYSCACFAQKRSPLNSCIVMKCPEKMSSLGGPTLKKNYLIVLIHAMIIWSTLDISYFFNVKGIFYNEIDNF